jgi:hypothetical protein
LNAAAPSTVPHRRHGKGQDHEDACRVDHVSLGGAAGSGQHLFEEIRGAPHLSLTDVRRFASGVLVLVYTPKAS